MPPPISDEKRAKILALCEAGNSCRSIAKEVGVSHDTVSRIAATIGHVFGRTNLARAREARSAFCAEVRADAAAKAQERVMELLLERMGEDQQEVVKGGEDAGCVVTRKANARDWRDWASAVSVLQRTVLDVDKHDNAGGQDVEAKGLIVRIVESARASAEVE